jgi:hypothetical protein
LVPATGYQCLSAPKSIYKYQEIIELNCSLQISAYSLAALFCDHHLRPR